MSPRSVQESTARYFEGMSAEWHLLAAILFLLIASVPAVLRIPNLAKSLDIEPPNFGGFLFVATFSAITVEFIALIRTAYPRLVAAERTNMIGERGRKLLTAMRAFIYLYWFAFGCLNIALALHSLGWIK